MKKLIGIIMLTAVLAVGAGPAFAADYASGTPVDFSVTASVPMATGVSITAVKVNALSNVWGSEVTDLDFNTSGKLDYDSTNGIWTSKQYFAINVGMIGGAASISTKVQYIEGTKPATQVKGMGYKATAKFVKIIKVFSGTTSSETETTLTPGTKLLNSLIGTGTTISQADIAGGYLRIYVGLFDGKDTTISGLGGEPFTSSDKPGIYNGTLRVTATIS